MEEMVYCQSCCARIWVHEQYRMDGDAEVRKAVVRDCDCATKALNTRRGNRDRGGGIGGRNISERKGPKRGTSSHTSN